MTDELRQTIGPFRVEGVIGRGGMGVVYRCTDAAGRHAAVKVQKPRKGKPEMGRRFARESRIRIDHPNVVVVLDTGTDDDGTQWIAFELLEGTSLQDRIRESALTPADAIAVVREAGRGVEAAHAMGVVHRDLKPANIFLCADGTVKVLDFGIARWADVEPELTIDKEVLGTPAYLAPEQARAEPDVDARADVWALGVVLYECLTGQRPFRRDSPVATMLALVLDEPKSIRSLAPHVPRMLAEIVSRAMRKTRDARWPSVRAFLDELAKVDVSAEAQASALARAHPERGANLVTRIETGGVSRPSRATTGIAADEKRVVAMLFAEDVQRARQIEVAVLDQGGAFVPLLGRTAIGVFGGESWEGDELERAARAALGCRSAAGRMSVASGRASTGDGGGVSGEAVAEAEQAAGHAIAGVAVMGESAKALSVAFHLDEVAPNVYEIRDERADYDPSGSPRTPTIGREVEIAQLSRAITACVEDEQGSLVVVVGPPGSGKSRMRREVESLVRAMGPATELLSGRGAPLHKGTSLALLASTLISYARHGAHELGWPRLDPSAAMEERRSAIVNMVERAIADPEAALRCATFLGALLGVRMHENVELSAARSDARLMADQLTGAVVEFIVALAARVPVVLLLEDLQWADDASLDMLEVLAERAAELPLLLVLTSRPESAEARPGLFANRDAIRLDLPRLSLRHVAELAEALAGRTLPAALVEAVTERTGGNPLFVEQIVQALAEDDLLDSPPGHLPLPRSVEAAVQSRLDHLPGPEKNLCKRAALYGRPFVAPELEALGTADVERLLGSLRRRGLLVAGPRPPDGTPREHRFRSTLVADVAYRMLSDDLRRELHRRAARVLARTGRTDPEELALHHERGHEPDAAARMYAEAATVAARRGDNITVLRCAASCEALGAPDDFVYPLHMLQAEALGFLGRRDEQGIELAEALEAAPEDASRARVMIAQATWLLRTSRLEDAAQVAADAVEYADKVGEPELRALARVRRIASLVYAGKLEEARAVLDETRELATSISAHTRAFISEARAHLAAALGNLGEREDAFRRAAELFRRTGDVRRAAANESNLADTYNRVGAYAEAEAALRDALEGCRRVGNRLGESYALLNLAYALGMLGRIDEALRTIEEARALPHVREDPRLMLTLRLYRAKVLAQVLDDPERTAGLTEEAADLAVDAARAGMEALRVGALAVAARVRLHSGDVAASLAASSEAMSVRDTLGSVEEDEAEVFLAHALALAASGDVAGAARVRERGRARLQYLALRIENPSVRSRFLHDVPAHRELAD